MGRPYDKPHLSFGDQLALLTRRGLECTDDAAAIALLGRVGYYRLSGYVYPFRELLDAGVAGDSPVHYRSDTISTGTTFEQVAALWAYDRKLRLTWLDALEAIEVGIRTSIAYVLGARDPFGHLEERCLDADACSASLPARAGDTGRPTAFTVWADKYESLRSNARNEDFVKHNLIKYDGQLPVWIAIEFFDFGATARLFGLLHRDDKNTIARSLGVKDGLLFSKWLEMLNYVRNICAHHGRLWNRALTLTARKFPEPLVPDQIQHIAQHDRRDKVYIPLALSAYLVRALDPGSNWPSTMRTALRKFPAAGGLAMTSDMGFPDGWDDLPLWKQH